MASTSRQPFTSRSSQSLHPAHSPARVLKPAQAHKRARSPDSSAHNLGSFIKKHKPTASNANSAVQTFKKDRTSEYVKRKEQQRNDREQQRLEFKEKYRRAFPGWTFYLDSESIDAPQLESFRSRILQLEGKIDHFFSKEAITHVISNRPVPNELDKSEKENQNASKISQPTQAANSPVKSRQQDGEEQKQDLIAKAIKFGHKIWNSIKLESVLIRCLEELATAAASPTTSLKPRNSHNLSKLLQSERIHGLSERDPTQKRHDYRYFTRGSYFVLIEDMRGELATIAAHEYPAHKEREGEKTPWPTVYCHPQARGPFILFDDKEKKRWDRLQQVEAKEKEERRIRCESFLKKQQVQKKIEPRLVARNASDLRRSVSMNNLRNAVQGDPFLDLDVDGDAIESINASGYLASGRSGYMAASGNSVGITSTTGTTSTVNYTSRNLQIPLNLSGRMRQEVVMRKQVQEKLTRANTMGPPADVPQRTVLKKSKSTNTLKLPKREEGSKPGYCESCRQKFDDFKQHIGSRRHRAFAGDHDNFKRLDLLLERVRRRTQEEREALYGRQEDICRQLHDQEPDPDADSIAIDD